MQERVAIIIPTYNRKKTTERCVNSLINGTYKNIKIILCDSDSTDGTGSIFENRNIHCSINVGSDSWWTAAINQGVTIARLEAFDFIIIMNDDIDISKTLIEQLMEKALANRESIISAAQNTKKGVFLGTRYISLFKYPVNLWSEELGPAMEVETSNGCCLLIPNHIFRRVGIFDELNCPQHAGDVEFQLRARRMGFITMSFPDIVIHQHDATDYFGKLKLRVRDIYTHKGSPLLISRHMAFGKQLFGSTAKYILLGIYYHIGFIRTSIKAIYIALRNRHFR